jgi:hypothetical protein
VTPPPREERKPVELEFIVDEAPDPQIQIDPRELALGVLQQRLQLQRHLSEKNLSFEGDLRKQSDFLRKLIGVKEERCDSLIAAERRRQAAADLDISPEMRAEAAKWLRRTESIQGAIDRVLASYGVTRYKPSGLAAPERDDIRETRVSPGVERGAIVEVLVEGYYWRGELLRPAVVVIAE